MKDNELYETYDVVLKLIESNNAIIAIVDRILDKLELQQAKVQGEKVTIVK